MFNLKCVLICVAIYVCFASSSLLRNNIFPLDLIHYNDFHDRFEETSVLSPVCQSNDTSCLGGFPRLFYEVRELRKQKPNALLLNAGDVFFGTYWYALLKWNVAQRFINMLPHDAHAIGNHEFDDGVEGLKSYLAALQAPVVVANIDASKDPGFEGLYSPYTVVERNGRKIGIVGVTTKDLPQLSNAGDLKFLDPIKAVKEQAQVLTEDGVNIIVVLSHCGLYVDQEIAKKAGENVDLIVGGHTHSHLWDGPSPTQEVVDGPYPVVVKSDMNTGHKILIVQASAYTKYLGNITVYFDEQGELVSYDAGPVFLNRSIPEDQEIKALLQPYKDKIDMITEEIVGYSNDDMNIKQCGNQECALGNFVADAFLYSTKEVYSSKLPNVAFVPRNMIKGLVSKGNTKIFVSLKLTSGCAVAISASNLRRDMHNCTCAVLSCFKETKIQCDYTGIDYNPSYFGSRITTSQIARHSLFEETSVATPICRFNNNSCLGGFPRLYHEIQVLFEEKPDAILLNAGDSFQGTFWYTLLKWNVTQEFMNLLPHDAHAIGNHEFDDGPEGLVPYLKALNAPVVAANLDSSDEPSLQGLYQPHVIVERNHRKIGIIGLITPETQTLSSPGNVKFTDPGEAAKREAEILTEEGVDIIVLLSHCGLDVDKDLARDYGENIDIIVGGHSHSLLWNGETPSGEPAVGPYPVFVETDSDTNHQVLIVQASAFTKYMGNLSVYFDYKGDFVKWEGNAIFLNRSIEEDEEIKDKLEPYAVLVHEAENNVVGETETTLSFEDCVFGECALGDLLVESMVEYAKENYNSSLHYLAFIQRGDIKSSILAGNITEGMIYELLPYKDKVFVFELLGKYVAEALERSVSDAWAYDPFKGPWVLQVSGLQVTYNVSKSQGSRITSLYIGDVGSTTPLEPNTYYTLVMPSFLADGGDGYTMFNQRRLLATIGRDSETVEAYIKNHSPLNVAVDGRITIDS